MKLGYLFLGAALLLAASHAKAGAFDDIAPPADDSVVQHRVWAMECDPDNGAPYVVGWDSSDQSIEIKTPHGRPYRYAGVPEQISPIEFQVVASRRDQRRSLIITFRGDDSSLRVIGRNSDGSVGGFDHCHVVKGWD